MKDTVKRNMGQTEKMSYEGRKNGLEIYRNMAVGLVLFGDIEIDKVTFRVGQHAC
jgi:hypothetical protein